MQRATVLGLTVSVAVLGAAGAGAGAQTASPMSFFVTSNGPGKGADLGGLAGADTGGDGLFYCFATN